jgi:hypothetical protein
MNYLYMWKFDTKLIALWDMLLWKEFVKMKWINNAYVLIIVISERFLKRLKYFTEIVIFFYLNIN